MQAPFVTRRRHKDAMERSAAMRDGLTASAAGRTAKARADHEGHIQSVIDGIAHEYYLASAIHHGMPGGNQYQIGAMGGLIRAMAVVTGRDIVTVGFQMERGIPQGPQGRNWTCTIDVIDGREIPVLLHDDKREPVEDRLATLRMAALCKDGHPLATILENR